MGNRVLIDNYLEKNKIYSELAFSNNYHFNEPLPNILICTQYIIDQLIAQDERKIAIVLPSDDCNIYPLIFSKALLNSKNQPNKTIPVIYDIEKGQRLRLGKAVVEFESIDKENNTLTFIVGKTDQVRVTSPIENFFLLFEKCDGALSKWETWISARKEAKSAFNNNADLISNRTNGRDTLLLLTSKNEFKQSVNDILINEKELQSLITYGEVDLSSQNNFKLYNKGKLNCIPAIGVSSRISEIAELVDEIDDYDCINSIYVTNDKCSEIINNTADLIACLKTRIPFIVFLSEENYESVGKLTDYGFKLWHWKPSTINNKIFIQKKYKNLGVFGNLPEKVCNAAVASFSAKLLQVEQYKKNLLYIKQLSKLTEDKDSDVRKITRLLWSYQNNLKTVSFINQKVIDYFVNEILEIKQEWERIYKYYKGQEFSDLINYLINVFDVNIQQLNYKENLLKELLKSNDCANKKVLIILPDKEFYDSNTEFDIESLNNFKKIDVVILSQFYRNTTKSFSTYDYVFVTWFDWFDKNDYLKIKQSYTYKKLIYVLFDFENKWRNALIKQVDNFIPHKEVINNGKAVGLSKKDYLDVAFDFEEDEALEDKYTEVTNLSFSRDILNSTIKSSSDINTNETVECLPIILSNKKIGYFHPNHSVIDITDLLFDENANPQKKEVSELRKGDRILIRQSGKDIIHEKADELMNNNHETNLRKQCERWTKLLQVLPSKLKIKEIVKKINELGGSCIYPQLRYWLTGESICPRNKETLIAIGKIFKEYFPEQNIDTTYSDDIEVIFDAGKKVHTYHQQAGRWLTKELKNKAEAIKNISLSSESKGRIDGIGEITIYKIEDILDQVEIARWELNRIGDLY